MTYVLFDIGGTNTRVAVSEDLEEFDTPIKFKTPVSYKEGFDMLLEKITELLDGRPCTAAAGGIRGILAPDKQSLMSDAILSKWVDQPFVSQLSKKLKAPVYIDNDTAVVGMGEAHFGAGEDSDILVYMTVSTGVGGVKIEQGLVDQAKYGFEPGHQILDVDQTILGEGTPPTLENLVSGSALEDRTGMKPFDIPQSDVVWSQLASYLAQGLRNTILYWSPDTIVLGGSMIVGDPRIMLDDIRRHTETVLDDIVPCPDIVDATLGDLGGLYGAMALIRQYS